MTEFDRDLTALAAALRRSTVRVHDGRRGSGSGVVWNGDGLIVTNAHVARGSYAEIEFEGRAPERAAVVRRDEARDLAALRSGRRDLTPVQVRNARTLLPGELVVAIGNPLGLVGALAAGVVQRRNPRWVVADVRLAPGNSGGPLADGTGRVVGINSMVVNGLGFAVPSEAVRAFLEAPSRRLGIAGVLGEGRFGARTTPLFVVTRVETGSVAERSGLAPHDAIYATDAGALDFGADLAASLGRATRLEIVRAGARRTIVPAWPADAREDSDAA